MAIKGVPQIIKLTNTDRPFYMIQGHKIRNQQQTNSEE
jgi:hypothetical protein